MSEPGWYPDPVDPASLRWFDGAAWSNFQRPVGADLSAPLTNIPTEFLPPVNIPPQPQSPQSTSVVPAEAAASKVWIAVVAAAVTVVLGGGVVLASAAGLGGSDSIEASPASAQRKAEESTAEPTTVAPTTAPPAAAPDTVPPTAPPPTAPPPTAPPPTEPPQLTAPSWDELKNASIPEQCGHPATKLVDGMDQTLNPNDGFFELRRSLYSGEAGILQGVPSNDAGPLTAVVVSCNGGNVSWPNMVMFFSSGGQYYGVGDLYEGLGWEAQGMGGPGGEGITSISLSGDQVQVYTLATKMDDPSCCPSTAAALSLRASGGRIIQSDLMEEFGD